MVSGPLVGLRCWPCFLAVEALWGCLRAIHYDKLINVHYDKLGAHANHDSGSTPWHSVFIVRVADKRVAFGLWHGGDRCDALLGWVMIRLPPPDIPRLSTVD